MRGEAHEALITEFYTTAWGNQAYCWKSTLVIPSCVDFSSSSTIWNRYLRNFDLDYICIVPLTFLHKSHLRFYSSWLLWLELKWFVAGIPRQHWPSFLSPLVWSKATILLCICWPSVVSRDGPIYPPKMIVIIKKGEP